MKSGKIMNIKIFLMNIKIKFLFTIFKYFVILNSINEQETEIKPIMQVDLKSFEIIGFSETLTNELKKNREDMFNKYFNHQNIVRRDDLLKIEAKIFQGNLTIKLKNFFKYLSSYLCHLN